MIRASDAKSWIHCQRRAWFDNHPPEGYEILAPSEFDQLVITLGNRHEWNIKRQLENQYQVVEAISEEHTKALMEAQAHTGNGRYRKRCRLCRLQSALQWSNPLHHAAAR